VRNILARSLQNGFCPKIGAHHVRRKTLAILVPQLREESVFHQFMLERRGHFLVAAFTSGRTACAICVTSEHKFGNSLHVPGRRFSLSKATHAVSVPKVSDWTRTHPRHAGCLYKAVAELNLSPTPGSPDGLVGEYDSVSLENPAMAEEPAKYMGAGASVPQHDMTGIQSRVPV
jgi:hypothetical protein